MWPNVVGVAGHGTIPVGLEFEGNRSKHFSDKTIEIPRASSVLRIPLTDGKREC